MAGGCIYMCTLCVCVYVCTSGIWVGCVMHIHIKYTLPLSLFANIKVVGPNKVQATFCYTFLTYSPSTKVISIGDIVSFESELDTQQKNWMPYERNESIYFYHSIYPGRVRPKIYYKYSTQSNHT
ncbi:hypothetical protein EON63_18425 [archaeon]|nr:MAG: hypothetical protein EON63_18425 [archaeon]